MKYKLFYLCALCHFGLSLTAWAGLYGWALAAQDSVSVAWGLAWIEWPLRRILLQPVAHWILTWMPFVWWTWSGLAKLVVLLAANSLAALAVAVAVMRTLRAWRRVR